MTVAFAENIKGFKCSGEQAGIDHSLEISLKDERIQSFYYFCATRNAAETTPCSVSYFEITASSMQGKGPIKFKIDKYQSIMAIEKSSGFYFDFSSLRFSDWFGSLSTMAKRIFIERGNHRCQLIENF